MFPLSKAIMMHIGVFGRGYSIISLQEPNFLTLLFIIIIIYLFILWTSSYAKKGDDPLHYSPREKKSNRILLKSKLIKQSKLYWKNILNNNKNK